jgi:hypothetical protein
MKNYYLFDEWCRVIEGTLLTSTFYGKIITISRSSWTPLFESELHPIDAIAEMEGINTIQSAVWYTRYKIEQNDIQ